MFWGYASEEGEEEGGEELREIAMRVSDRVSRSLNVSQLSRAAAGAQLRGDGVGEFESRLRGMLDQGTTAGPDDDGGGSEDSSTIGHVMDAFRRRAAENSAPERRILDELDSSPRRQRWGPDFDETFGEPAAALPRPTTSLPPGYARVYFKVVAAVGGRFLSIYDGHTEYQVGTTVMQDTEPRHSGGIYVYPSIEQCLKRDAANFPAESRLLHAPRAIARVKAWNRSFADEPVRYGIKRAFTFVHTLEILPYPLTWAVVGARGELLEEADPTGERLVMVDGLPAPSNADRGRRLFDAQVATVGLEQDVAEMERRLAVARGELSPEEYLRS